MRAITGMLLAILATLAWAGEVYTWKDASGKIHYSDTPPPGVSSKKLRAGSSSGSAAGQPAATKGLAEQEMEFRKRKTESDQSRAKAEKEQSDSAEAKSNCEQARRQVQALESGQRMSRINEAGEQVPLDDDMRAQDLDKARKAVQSWCK